MRCPRCGESLKKDKVSLDEDISEEKEIALKRLLNIPGISKKEAEILYDNGFKSPKEIVDGGMRELAGIYRFSFDTSDSILENAKKVYVADEQKEEPKKEEEIEDSKSEEISVEDLTKDVGEFEWKEKRKEYDEDKTIEEILEDKRKKESPEEEKPLEKEVKSKQQKDIVVEKDRVERKTITRFNLFKGLFLFLSFAIPIFLLIFTSLELLVVLLGYPSVYAHPVLFYLSPAYLVELSWLSSLTLSFLAILLLTVLSLKYYDFSPSEAVYIKKRLLLPSFLMNILIGGSLSLHIYHAYDASPDILTYLILSLLIFLSISHITLLIIDKRVSPFKKEKRKVCPECKNEMSFATENCPNCGVGIPKIGSPSFEKKEEITELPTLTKSKDEEAEEKEIEESSSDKEEEDDASGDEKEETSESEKSKSEEESITSKDGEKSSTESNEEDKEGQEEDKTDKKESEDKDKKDSPLGDKFAGFGEKVRESVEERLEDESEKEDT